jgi:hypothetical protein
MLRRGRGARQNAHSVDFGGRKSPARCEPEDLRGIPVLKMGDYVVPFSGRWPADGGFVF